MKHSLVLAFVFVAVSSAILGYFLGTATEFEHKQTTKTVFVEITPSPSPVVLSYLDELIEEREKVIREALTAKNFQKLLPLMADEVLLVKEGSGCCGELEPIEVVDELDILTYAKNPWNFERELQTPKRLRALDKEIWHNADILGISSNGYAVAVNLNSDDEIIGIAITKNWQDFLEKNPSGI